MGAVDAHQPVTKEQFTDTHPIPLKFWSFPASTLIVPVNGSDFINQGTCRFLPSDP
jgi:hypothetical protein